MLELQTKSLKKRFSKRSWRVVAHREPFVTTSLPFSLALLLALPLALLTMLGPVLANAQQSPVTRTEQTQPRETSKPYTGDFSVFDYKGRDKKLQVDRVMDILEISAGKRVADIGAGSGWFSVRAARRVAQAGVVYAVDINPEAIQYIQQRAKREGISNIKTILGKPADPLLPPQSVDAVLLLKAYHEVAEPVELLKNLRKSLRPGALVGIIDRNGTPDNHGVNEDIVRQEVKEAGYTLIGRYDFVKGDREDYFLVFKPL
ncbi:MAG TPA: class I SAM-dependent methyltransferase [Candidatus Angelobacter sp.]|nr:class I SAM-dependent methyltransferase [Candidatus Angelobacter sp.]